MELYETNHLIEVNDAETLAIIDALEMLGVAIHRGHPDYTQWDFEFVDRLIREFTQLTPYGDGDVYVEGSRAQLQEDIRESLPSDVEYEDEVS